MIEKKDTVVRVIDQKAENFSKEIVVKGFTKADKKVSVKSETSGKIIDLPIAQGTLVKRAMLFVLCLLLKDKQILIRLYLTLTLPKNFMMKNFIHQNNCKMQSQIMKELNLELIMQASKAPFDGVVDKIDLDVEIF